MAPAVASVASANGGSGAQEKRYRSMQEHIRRAHPENYISKLPATEESFQLMINTPPSERPPPPTSSNLAPNGYGNGNDKQSYYGEDSSTPNTPRNLDEYQVSNMLPAASAAAALAQLHNHKLEQDWDLEGDWMSDTEVHKQAMRSSIELPPLHGNHHLEPTSDPFSRLNAHRRELLPSISSTSPPGRSSTLPPIQRNPSHNRPRKQSVSKRAREPQHKRQKSRGETAHLRRMSYDRKAYSAEPSSALSAVYGKRWEDLIDAATSATEDVDDDRTPVPPSPVSVNRASMPPFSANQFQGYQASPLQQALTPPSNLPDAPEPFPSVESGESGDMFHIESRGLSDSSPSFSSQSIQIYCAACQGISLLKESYACTECICGLCRACVDVLMAEQGARRKCPRCATIGGRFKPFQLDIR
ncbi:related to transcription factor RfeD [Rhynchosporium agropyri]|uniref:Related to transcription factor RfeD n=3 Tax=Rhynchosporium TaxID=38037 RepID=A0A1E1ME60_RHYSE|nr:related to transcription factor RfeD [Rhynchosporium agropyri]CZT03504.1 uncharacterized protein RCO7_06117 [Rhynchosporium commune]CZT47360.1 related to transcription factor RfeD [Rhynchosporium secalis]